jgi:5-formyltetrahydrofolate cyclo-ligase
VEAVIAESKAQHRARLLAARRELSTALRDAEARQLCDHLPAVVAGTRAQVVCAYLPVGTEPGSEDMVVRLLQLCDEVLLPVAHIDSSGGHLPLQWGRYVPGALVAARFGLREPPPPWLSADEVRRASVILVPALAVDRSGVRLGRGGGFYDRSLALCGPQTRLVAVVRDDEVLDELPSEPHDIRMTHVLTPSAGVVRLRE